MASIIVVELMAGFVGVGVARLVARATRSRKKRVTIMDYRRGVRSAGGKMGEVLSPGCYSYDTRKETILVVDMRPQPVLIERLFCRDALNRKVVISAATELSVLDAVKASTRLRDQIRDTAPIISDTLREVVSRRAIDVAGDGHVAIAQDVTRSVNSKLCELGMKVSSVEITERWVDPDPASGAVPQN